MDDVLIRAGGWMAGLVALVALACTLLPADGLRELRELLGLGVLGLAAIALAPVGLLAAGYHVRGREQRVHLLHGVLERQLELRVRDFLANTEFTRESLEATLRDLNESGLGFYVWDRDADLIQDARLRQGELHFDECSRCRASLSITVQVGTAVAAECPYCDARIDDGDLARARQRLIDEIRRSERPVVAASAYRPTWREGRHDDDPSFNFLLFGFLLLVFWPLGVGYAVRYAYKHG